MAHVFQPVHARLVVDLRQIGLGPLADAGDLRALLGLAADDLDSRVFFLEETRAAHDGARGAHAADEMRDRPLGVAPDFRPRALVVRERIVGVGELVEDTSLALALHLLGEAPRGLHSARLGREDDLYA